jgi:ferric-dicitrate binding protein FerR (iron transport regulator)
LQKHRGAQVWEEVTTQKKLYLGDELQALPGSAVVLRLRGNSVLRLEAAGRLRVTEYNGEAEFGLTHGTLRATLASPHPPFAVSTPQGLIRALGTDFEVSVE